MGGLDILIMTGGIGENADTTREGVLSDLDYLGISIDLKKNIGFRSEGVISTPESKVKIVVVPTDEELMIALDTEQIVADMKKVYAIPIN
jgi:acetate kinase